MTTDLACPVCGEGRLHLDQTEKVMDIGGATWNVPFHAHWCDACGAQMGLNEDLKFNARAMRQTRKKHVGLLTGEEVRNCRKSLGLSQEQAAQLFGGGPVAFSKYENDEVAQSDAMDRLIWLVATFPALMIPLADRLNLTLSGSAKIVIEKTKIKAREEYFVNAGADFEYTKQILAGFGKPRTFASNDRDYQPKSNARAAVRLVA